MANSLTRRAVAVVAVLMLLVFVFASTSRDSAQEGVLDAQGRPRLGTAIRFEATAYCKGETTAAGTGVRTGMAAADPALLPLGTVLRVEAPSDRYNGIWTVMDTGPEVKGRELDLYVWSCYEALAFGRKDVRVTILRLGWDPQNSAPTVIEQLFRRRERARSTEPSEPPPAEPAPGVEPAAPPPDPPLDPPSPPPLEPSLQPPAASSHMPPLSPAQAPSPQPGQSPSPAPRRQPGR